MSQLDDAQERLAGTFIFTEPQPGMLIVTESSTQQRVDGRDSLKITILGAILCAISGCVAAWLIFNPPFVVLKIIGILLLPVALLFGLMGLLGVMSYCLNAYGVVEKRFAPNRYEHVTSLFGMRKVRIATDCHLDIKGIPIFGDGKVRYRLITKGRRSQYIYSSNELSLLQDLAVVVSTYTGWPEPSDPNISERHSHKP